MSSDLCEIRFVDASRIDRARRLMPAGRDLAASAEVFRMLGDPTRLRLLHALAAAELCVCDLAALLKTTSSAISHQLRLLRAAGMVRFRKEGKMAYYSLGDDRLGSFLAEGLRRAGRD